MVVVSCEEIVLTGRFVVRKDSEDGRRLPRRAFGEIAAVTAPNSELGTVDDPGGAVVAPEIGASRDMDDVAGPGGADGEPRIMKRLVTGSVAEFGVGGDELIYG